MADDDFVLTPPVGNLNRLVSREVPLGVEPASLVPSIIQDFRTKYALSPTIWILQSYPVKTWRFEPESGLRKVWYRIVGFACPSEIEIVEVFPPDDVEIAEVFPPEDVEIEEIFPPEDVEIEEVFPPDMVVIEEVVLNELTVEYSINGVDWFPLVDGGLFEVFDTVGGPFPGAQARIVNSGPSTVTLAGETLSGDLAPGEIDAFLADDGPVLLPGQTRTVIFDLTAGSNFGAGVGVYDAFFTFTHDAGNIVSPFSFQFRGTVS